MGLAPARVGSRDVSRHVAGGRKGRPYIETNGTDKAGVCEQTPLQKQQKRARRSRPTSTIPWGGRPRPPGGRAPR